RRPQLRNQPRLTALLEPLHHRLDDDERHPRQPLELLVAMHPTLEIDLAQALDAQPLGGVDEMADLDRIAGEEGDRLEQRAAAGVLAGQRLDEAGQLREEEVDQRPRDKLRDAATAAFLEDAALDDGPLVVALDVLQPRLVEERPQGPVDHPRVPVADVGVGPDDDVARRLVERLPERLALAVERAVAGQDVGVADAARAYGC